MSRTLVIHRGIPPSLPTALVAFWSSWMRGPADEIVQLMIFISRSDLFARGSEQMGPHRASVSIMLCLFAAMNQ